MVASYASRLHGRGNYLGGFLHLVSNVDLSELLKEAQHGKLQFLVPSLCQARVCQVHQLQYPEGRERRSNRATNHSRRTRNTSLPED